MPRAKVNKIQMEASNGGLRGMGKRRKGNPNWGHTNMVFVPPATTLTEFEKQVQAIGLNLDVPEQLVRSRKLLDWIRSHKNSRYVPEWLLKHHGLQAEVNSFSIGDWV